MDPNTFGQVPIAGYARRVALALERDRTDATRPTKMMIARSHNVFRRRATQPRLTSASSDTPTP